MLPSKATVDKPPNFRKITRLGLWITCLLFLYSSAWLQTAAHAYEYFEDHEEMFYDLDTAQSQAKYDTRLLSEQMLSEKEQQEQSLADEAVSIENDLQPHGRAASCYTNGRKYTHGQKVPRTDVCEVCLCMDGEIFCWWEKCDKNKIITTSSDYSDPYHDTTTTTTTDKYIEINRHHTKATRKYPKHKKIKNRNADYQKKLLRKEHLLQQQENSKSGNIKYTHELPIEHEIMEEKKQQQQQQQQQQHKHNNDKNQQTVQHINQASQVSTYHAHAHNQQQQQKQYQHQQQQHLHAHPHSTSKILNFPENLPSLLYYDYKTEEHEHHQHQHHQQHLMHQQQQRLQRQQQQNKQKLLLSSTSTTSTSTESSLANKNGYVDAIVNDKNFDDAETDSDILPEPPTKKPKLIVATTTTTTTATATISTAAITKNIDATNATTTEAVAAATATTGIDLNTDTDINAELATVSRIVATSTAAVVAATIDINAVERTSQPENQIEQQPAASTISNKNDTDAELDDDAFHRWLTSTEFIADNENTYDINLVKDTAEGETTARTMAMTTAAAIAFNTIVNDNSNNVVGAEMSNMSKVVGNSAVVENMHLQTSDSNVMNDIIKAKHSEIQNEDVGKAAQYAIIRSTETDYSNEVNGSVVKIDISLTTVDEKLTDLDLKSDQQPYLNNLTKVIEDHRVTPTATMLTSTTPSLNRQCNVMGTMYNIGDILPQDTGNCLQCICIDGSTSDDTPRITCSPHNCPPLVLPDLLDATGY